VNLLSFYLDVFVTVETSYAEENFNEDKTCGKVPGSPLDFLEVTTI